VSNILIQITLKKNRSGYVVKGHAGYAEHGNDIVCSAVSTLAQVIAQSLKAFSQVITHHEESGHIDVEIRRVTRESNVLMYSFETGVREIARQYPKYVKIVEEWT
jgi:uncharacterized protein